MAEKENGVKDALIKCAVGLSASEVVEEYAMDGGEFKLIKKKVTKRDIPPDIKAVKMLMEGESLSAATDEELVSEREKLIKQLKEEGFEQ